MSKRLVIVGNGEMAELFCSHFTHTTDYRVAGFSVDSPFIKEDHLLGLPVVPLEEVQSRFPPESFHAFVAIGPVKNNTVRAARFDELHSKGYRFANYINPKATISPDVTLGKNVVVGASCVLLPWSRIGDNVLIGTGSIVGHHCHLHRHAYLALHVVMAGSVVVGERAFVGAGVTIRDNVTIGEGSVVGAGTTILGDVEPNAVYVPERAKKLDLTSDQVRL